MATGLANLTEEFESFARAAKVLEEWKISTAKNMDDMFLIIMGIIIYRKLVLFIHLFAALNYWLHTV